MKGKLILTGIFLFFIAAICLASEVSGVWQGKINDQFEITVDLKSSGAKVSGLVKSEIGDMSLSDGQLVGNEISFKELSFNGIAVSYIKGKLEGDKINVTVGFQGQDFKGTLVRIK